MTTKFFCGSGFYGLDKYRLNRGSRTPAWSLHFGGIFVLLATFSGHATAGLGAAPLPTSSPQLSQSLQLSPSGSGAKTLASPRPAAYTAHETGLESGTTIKEYATAAGVVFAVQWRGPVLPDLEDLLGTHFATFRAEAQKSRAAGRRGSPMTVTTDTLIVNSTGRMRNFVGWAYAPGLVPADVSIKDVLQ